MKTGLRVAAIILVAGIWTGYAEEERLKQLETRAQDLRTELDAVEAEIEKLQGGAVAQDPVLMLGKTQFDAVCSACHFAEPRPGAMVAPPVFAILMHYQTEYKTEEAFAAAIAAWATQPSLEQSKMPGAVSRFGLMPPLPLGEDNLKAIGRYLYRSGQKPSPGTGKSAGASVGASAGGSSG